MENYPNPNPKPQVTNLELLVLAMLCLLLSKLFCQGLATDRHVAGGLVASLREGLVHFKFVAL